MIYVDRLLPCVSTRSWPYRESCHLFGTDWEELHRFAARLGLKHSWFQRPKRTGGLAHYDLTAGMRIKAVKAGAVEVLGGKEILAAYEECGYRTIGSVRASGMVAP